MCEKPTTVTLKDLRLRLGYYINRVITTRVPLTITDRGRPVARLTPLPIEEANHEMARRPDQP